MESIKEMLDRSERVQPIAEINGIKITTFEDQVAMANADHIQNVGLSLPEFNPDGSIAATPTKWAAINTEILLNNRYRVVDEEYQVVSSIKDYLSIKGLESGRMPYPQVQADVITKDKNGKPKYKTTVTVTDTEFMETFTHRFSREDMAKILPLIMNERVEPEETKSIFK